MADEGEGRGHPRMSAGFPSASSGQSEESKKGLAESAREATSHLGEMAGQMKEKAREYVSGMAGQGEEAWRRAREGLHEGFSNVSQRAGDIWEDATDFIRRYPVASLAVAFGLGFLTSCALSGMSRLSSDDMTERMSRASS
jgi:ElaB/YqjD/DUF883 family membrane-anchored ribosome-binding protein